MFRQLVVCAALVACALAVVEIPSRYPEPEQDQSDPDAMVNHLLQWIQGFYQQRNRKARQYQGAKPDRPRPFELSYLPPTGYPPAGSRPTPEYNDGPLPQPGSSSQPPKTNIPSSETPYPPAKPIYGPNQPAVPTKVPEPTYQPPKPPAPQPEEPTYQPSVEPSQVPFEPSPPSQPDEQPAQPDFEPSQPDYQPSPSPNYPVPDEQVSPTPDNDDDRHPPHIHEITVDCGKEMMTINIEFNKAYNGIIYSQDHFKESDCVYVRENSNQIKYSFTVSLDKCGTRFFSDFENEGQAYLENVLVLQNEPGIQEVWDHIRRVRCLWEGSLTKQLVSSLSVGMLNQITSNFSGDTAMARLDIQAGRGPFAPEATGLIKIGDTMTLVVSVTGDPGFDVVVRECIAKDSGNVNIVRLTDSNGCVLKPKLFGEFQKTRETGNTGATIIAYAFFNAFKFPDEMDLIIQCDVELCKTDCDVCPNPGSLEPKRRRRDLIHYGNKTIEPVTTIGKGLRVVFADDLPVEPLGNCISSNAAIWGSFLVLIGSVTSSLLVSYCWHRSRASVKLP